MVRSVWISLLLLSRRRSFYFQVRATLGVTLRRARHLSGLGQSLPAEHTQVCDEHRRDECESDGLPTSFYFHARVDFPAGRRVLASSDGFDGPAPRQCHDQNSGRERCANESAIDQDGGERYPKDGLARCIGGERTKTRQHPPIHRASHQHAQHCVQEQSLPALLGRIPRGKVGVHEARTIGQCRWSVKRMRNPVHSLLFPARPASRVR